MARDFYEILGVKRDASEAEVKRAYRTLAKQHHPDRNPDDPQAERKFKEVQEAYNTLRNPEKRAQYDEYGAAGVGQWRTTPQGQRVYQWAGGSAVDMDDLEDLFSAFGAGADIFDRFTSRQGPRTRARPQPRRGPDHEQEVTISFDQAVHGTTLSLQLDTGGRDGRQAIDVKIPPGVEDGQRIRVRGRVPGSHGGPPGDLILRVRVSPHPYFTRRGADVYVEVPVSLDEAALGAKIDVPSLDAGTAGSNRAQPGRTTVTLPPGTPSGAKLRLAGRGAQKSRSKERGDLYVVVRIVPPKSLSDEERKLYERLRELNGADPRRDAPWNRGS